MANRRMITTAIWGDEFFGMLDYFQRILWIGIFSAVADDQGRMIDNLHLLKSKIFIYDDFDPKIIDSALELFQQEAKILRYKIGNKRYIQIVNWWKHQQPQWAQPSQYPAPDGWTDSIRTRINGQYLEENWHNGGYNLDYSPEVVPEQVPEPPRRIVYPNPNPNPDPDLKKQIPLSPNGDGGVPKSPKQPTKSEFVLTMEYLEAVFAEARGAPLPDWDKDAKGANKRWRTPIGQIYNRCGKDKGKAEEIIKRAVSSMVHKELIFDAPDQILRTSLSMIIDQGKPGAASTFTEVY